MRPESSFVRKEKTAILGYIFKAMEILERRSLRQIRAIVILILAVPFSLGARAQQAGLPDPPRAQADAGSAPAIRNIPRNILHDQEAIWTSPLHLDDSSGLEAVLLVGATTVVVTTDHQVMSQHFLDPSTNDHANTASTGLTGLFIAAPVAFYGLGRLRQNSGAQETGILAGEAMADSLAVNEVFKIVSRRERPALDGAKGKFFQPGVNFDSSFASNHAVIAWSSAAVIASEYGGPMTKIGVYGLATGVSLARVAGRDHFPSDVLVGSAVGWMIGRYVYRHHRHVDEM